jgi:predicted small lipoprotein YifL
VPLRYPQRNQRPGDLNSNYEPIRRTAMKRTIIGTAMAFTFALTGCGGDDVNPLPPAQVVPDDAAERQPLDDDADLRDRPWGGQDFE